MTEHPLTDEMCEVIATEKQWADNIGPVIFRHGDMRAAADWQLEKVIEYIVVNDWFAEPGWRIAELRKAMRPQENN